jgi:hypothetical protein
MTARRHLYIADSKSDQMEKADLKASSNEAKEECETTASIGKK